MYRVFDPAMAEVEGWDVVLGQNSCEASGMKRVNMVTLHPPSWAQRCGQMIGKKLATMGSRTETLISRCLPSWGCHAWLMLAEVGREGELKITWATFMLMFAGDIMKSTKTNFQGFNTGS